MREYLSALMLIIIFAMPGCKPEEPCVPPLKPADSKLVDFMPDKHYPNLIYKNSLNEQLKFNYSNFSSEYVGSPDPCKAKVQFIILSYTNNSEISSIVYQIDGSTSSGYLSMQVEIGNQYGSCFSPFHVVLEDTNNYLDTLELNGETFTDVQYKATAPSFCSTELYYSPKYGLVAFKWKEEWYVLEKDSLQ